jgi:ADP-heptose:LPS heptosyltransferase
MADSSGKILVIRGGAIGDFILTLPAIAALRRQFPNAHLEVLGYSHIVSLALAGGLVDRARSIESRALAAFFGRNAELAEEMTDYFSEFDLIVSYLYDPDTIFRTNVARCSPAQFIAGPHRPDASSGLHASKVFLKPLERLAIFDADPVPRLALTADCSSAARGLDAGRLALHPGSGSEQKNWPEAKWADLLQYVMERAQWQILLVGGEAEGERLQRLSAALPPTRVRVAQSLPLVELAGLLQHCAAFIGHDSGISHLAAALGLPGLILWGDTAQEVWRPPSQKVRILHNADGLGNLELNEVVHSLELIRLA